MRNKIDYRPCDMSLALRWFVIHTVTIKPYGY
jgi:hypothetical protein